MYEVEVKVRADHDDLRDRLMEVVESDREMVVQRDRYFDAPHRDFEVTDEALRIREEVTITSRADTVAETIEEAELRPGRAWVTYKGPLVEAESKTREEVESQIESARAMTAVLEHVGFEIGGTVRKVRETYGVGEYQVTLDSVLDLGMFVEVEASANESEIETVRNGARDLLATLGLDPDAQIRTSYLEMLLERK